MKSLNQKLFILLGIQLVIVALVWWPRMSKTHTAQSLFGDLKWQELQSLSIQDEKTKVTLNHVDSKWLLPEKYDYPADEKKIEEFFKKLGNIKPGNPVGQTAASYRRLEVGDEKFQRKIVFEKKGDKENGLYLGTAPQFRQIHIRKMGDKEVYATDQIAAYDLPVQTSDWLDHALVHAKSEEVMAIEIKRGHEALAFHRVESKDKDGKTQSNWMLDGKAVNKSKFDALLRNVADLQLSEVLGKDSKVEYGFNQPIAQVKLTLKQGESEKTINFTVGKKIENDYVAHLEGTPFYVKVSQAQVSPILQNKKQEFTSK